MRKKTSELGRIASQFTSRIGVSPGASSAPVGSRSFVALQGRFDHFQHRHREPLVWEFPTDLPTLPVVELDGRCVGFENAKPECSTTATKYFSFGVCQQSLANAESPTLAQPP